MNIEEYSRFGIQLYRDEAPRMLLRYLRRNKWKNYLDCGCGDGSLLYALDRKKYFKGKKVVAIDLSHQRIHLVRQISPDILARVDNVETLKTIKSGRIDFLVSTQVIEHVDDRKMIKAMHRVLKRNGLIYLSTIYKKWYGWYFYRNHGEWTIDPTHVREYTHDVSLMNLFSKKQFKCIESKKTLLTYPLIDVLAKRVFHASRKIFWEEKNIFIRSLRSVGLPIPGYYIWELVFKKIK